ncbi:MAG: site-2 protease family protein [Acidimicrobiales bacterium]
MNDSLRLGRILGIPVGVNWSIVAVAVLFTVTLAVEGLPRAAPEASLAVRWVVASLAVLAFFASILAHELGHAVVALGHGVNVSGITLWLLGGVAKLDRQSPTARAELRIAAAGPAVSFVLGLFFTAVTVIALAIAPDRLLVASLAWLAGINLLLAAFNLLPAAPLDGGRVLTAILWRRLGDAERARIIAGRCGLILGVVMAIGGLLQVFLLGQAEGWLTVLVGGFTLMAARAEISGAVIRRRLATTRASAVMAPTPPAVPDTITAEQLERWAGPAGRLTAHPVVRWGVEPIGWVVPAQVDELDGPNRTWTVVRQLMRPLDAALDVRPDTTIEEILRHWDDRPDQIAVVRCDGGTPAIAGTVTGGQLEALLAPSDLWGRNASAARPGAVPPPSGPRRGRPADRH